MACSRVKLWVCLFFAIISLALLLPAGVVSAADPVVNFPDANLEAAIREEINKPTGNIYQSDLQSMDSLEAKDKNISDLTGLEYCTDLSRLVLDNNLINDISPLASLPKLSMLEFENNQVNNISPLASLANLSLLYCKNNRISDISALALCTNIDALIMDNNLINDISPLASLTKITLLRLENNSISDISPLAALVNITDLSLNYNHITDVSALSQMTKLTWLELDNNLIRDISPLVYLPKLEFLFLNNNPLNVTSRVDILPRLQNAGITVDYTPYPSTTTAVTASKTPVPSKTSTSIPAYTRDTILVVAAFLTLVVLAIIGKKVSDTRRRKQGKYPIDTGGKVLTDKYFVNRLNIMNTLAIVLWAGPSIYLYWREWFRPEDTSTNYALGVGFIFFVIALGFLLGKLGKQPDIPATKWLGIACVTLVAAIAVGMAAFPLSYSLYLYRIHQNSGLRDVPLSEVVNTTFPGDTFARETMIKTPTLDGEAELGHGETFFWIDTSTLKTTWPVGDEGVIQDVSVRYVDYTSKITNITSSNSFFYDSDILDKGSSPSTNAITVILSIPQDDIPVPFQVTGHAQFDALVYYVVDRIREGEHSGHYDTVIGRLESQNVSFRVYPKSMGAEITLERDMYKKTATQIPELMIAISALIPLILMMIGLNSKRKYGKIIKADDII
jgi:hypothetical protein